MPGEWIEKTEPECRCADKPDANVEEFGAASKWKCECGNLWIYTGISWELMPAYPSIIIEFKPERNWLQKLFRGEK